jgi:hypothetical protein
VLTPIIRDFDTIPKLTFGGETADVLFPAKVSCVQSLLDRGNHQS